LNIIPDGLYAVGRRLTDDRAVLVVVVESFGGWCSVVFVVARRH